MDAESQDATPEKFYKYHSLNGSSALHLISTLLNKEVHFSSPQSFNDPFDCKPRYGENLTRELFIENFIRIGKRKFLYLKEEMLFSHAEAAWNKNYTEHGSVEALILSIQKEMGVLLGSAAIYCVSEKNDDILMWGHYADSHRGICLEFDSGSKFLENAMRVDYEDTRPVVQVFAHEEKLDNMRKSLLVKSEQWKYEKEWRVVELSKPVGLRKIEDKNLTGIIFGSAISESLQNTIRNICKKHPTPINLYKATPDDFEFKLRIELL